MNALTFSPPPSSQSNLKVNHVSVLLLKICTTSCFQESLLFWNGAICYGAITMTWEAPPTSVQFTLFYKSQVHKLHCLPAWPFHSPSYVSVTIAIDQNFLNHSQVIYGETAATERRTQKFRGKKGLLYILFQWAVTEAILSLNFN